MSVQTYLCIGYSQTHECVSHLVNAENPHAAADAARNDFMHPTFAWEPPFTLIVCSRCSVNLMRTNWLPVAISQVDEGTQTSEPIGVRPASVLGWNY